MSFIAVAHSLEIVLLLCPRGYITKRDSVFFLFPDRSLVTEIKSLRVNLSDFKVKTVIGRGHFGEVKLVQERQTNDVYAMKILKKCKTLYNESASV